MKFIVEPVLKKVYVLLFLFLHLLYHWQNEIRDKLLFYWKHAVHRLSSCLPSRSYAGELVKLNRSVNRFSKVPRHLAISVVVEEGRELDLHNLAKVVSWAWVAGIPVVTLYDYHGRIKNAYRELGCYVREELIQNFWALKKLNRGEDPPAVKFHNIPRINGYANGIHSNGYTSNGEMIHVALTSYEDGKPEIVRIARNIEEYTQSSTEDPGTEDNDDHKLNTLKDISSVNEKMLDDLLSRKVEWTKYVKAPIDPDVLMIVGDIHSTLGFLPWHLRLTEMYWLPKLHLAEVQDFYSALARFSKCQQRFGT